MFGHARKWCNVLVQSFSVPGAQMNNIKTINKFKVIANKLTNVVVSAGLGTELFLDTK